MLSYKCPNRVFSGIKHVQANCAYLKASQRRQVRGFCKLADSIQISSLEKGQELVKAEIPAFIQRSDMLRQLYRWATIDIASEGVAEFGVPCSVMPVDKGDITWGFIIQFLKNGEPLGELLVCFDEEVTKKYKYVARTKDGWPSIDGVPFDEIEGKHLEVWRLGPDAFPDELKEPAQGVLKGLATAVDRYYSFGSVFSDVL